MSAAAILLCCCSTCRPEPRCLGYDIDPETFENVWPPLAEYLGVTTEENVETVDFKVTFDFGSISGGSFTKRWFEVLDGATVVASSDLTATFSQPAGSMVVRPKSMFDGCVAAGQAYSLAQNAGGGSYIEFDGNADTAAAIKVSASVSTLPTSWQVGNTQYETRNFVQEETEKETYTICSGELSTDAITLGLQLYTSTAVNISYEVREREYDPGTETWGDWSSWATESAEVIARIVDPGLVRVKSSIRNSTGPVSDTFPSQTLTVQFPVSADRGGQTIANDSLTFGATTATLARNDESDPQLLAAPREFSITNDDGVTISYRQRCYDVSAACPTNFALDRVWVAFDYPGAEPPTIGRLGPSMWAQHVPSTGLGFSSPVITGYIGEAASPVLVDSVKLDGTPDLTQSLLDPTCADCPATINLAVDGTGYEELNGNYALAQTGDDCVWTLSVDGTTVTLDTINGGQTWRLFLDGPTQEVEFRAVRTCVCPLRSDWIVQAPGVGTAITS